MQVKVEHLEGVKFTVAARGHVIVSDQPVEDGGTDEGMTPPEMLLGSLASCAAYYAAYYLKARKLASAGTEVIVTAEKLANPSRIDHFKIEVIAPVALTPEQVEGIDRAVHRCIVHNTLLTIPTITTTVRGQNGAAMQAAHEAGSVA